MLYTTPLTVCVKVAPVPELLKLVTVQVPFNKGSGEGALVGTLAVKVCILLGLLQVPETESVLLVNKSELSLLKLATQPMKAVLLSPDPTIKLVIVQVLEVITLFTA